MMGERLAITRVAPYKTETKQYDAMWYRGNRWPLDKSGFQMFMQYIKSDLFVVACFKIFEY